MKEPLYIIGLGPGGEPLRDGAAPGGCSCAAFSLADEALRIIEAAEVLVGGREQLALFAEHPGEKIPVGAEAASLYERIRNNREEGKRQVLLCSGDPLFYGLGARLAEFLGLSGTRSRPEADSGEQAVRILPGISSLQTAAALLGRSWEGVVPVSLHGRGTFLPLAHALFRAEGAGQAVFALTDAVSHPAAVAAWMLERGLSGMRMHVLEDLWLTADGQARAERCVCLELEQALGFGDPDGCSADRPPGRPSGCSSGYSSGCLSGHSSGLLSGRLSGRLSCCLSGRPPRRVLWLEGMPPPPPFGLDDNAFARENRLITKGPVRAAGLARLGIEPGHTVWDLGAGSGAVAVEAARLARCGRVYAVESKPERLALIRENRRRFRALNLEIVQGKLPDCLPDLAGLPNLAGMPSLPDLADMSGRIAPDRIFLGGGLGGDNAAAEETLTRAWAALRPGGRLLAHCVLLSSLERARAQLAALGATVSVTLVQTAESAPLAGDLRLEALNPVFLVLGEKRA